ncbi:hypothetical protein HDU92_008985 [Lobulomyces angularis]|nr:hypothetical protein HDU92_008985 [Lobulomyces angularis]
MVSKLLLQKHEGQLKRSSDRLKSLNKTINFDALTYNVKNLVTEYKQIVSTQQSIINLVLNDLPDLTYLSGLKKLNYNEISNSSSESNQLILTENKKKNSDKQIVKSASFLFQSQTVAKNIYNGVKVFDELSQYEKETEATAIKSYSEKTSNEDEAMNEKKRPSTVEALDLIMTAPNTAENKYCNKLIKGFSSEDDELNDGIMDSDSEYSVTLESDDIQAQVNAFVTSQTKILVDELFNGEDTESDTLKDLILVTDEEKKSRVAESEINSSSSFTLNFEEGNIKLNPNAIKNFETETDFNVGFPSNLNENHKNSDHLLAQLSDSIKLPNIIFESEVELDKEKTLYIEGFFDDDIPNCDSEQSGCSKSEVNNENFEDSIKLNRVLLEETETTPLLENTHLRTAIYDFPDDCNVEKSSDEVKEPTAESNLSEHDIPLSPSLILESDFFSSVKDQADNDLSALVNLPFYEKNFQDNILKGVNECLPAKESNLPVIIFEPKEEIIDAPYIVSAGNKLIESDDLKNQLEQKTGNFFFNTKCQKQEEVLKLDENNNVNDSTKLEKEENTPELYEFSVEKSKTCLERDYTLTELKQENDITDLIYDNPNNFLFVNDKSLVDLIEFDRCLESNFVKDADPDYVIKIPATKKINNDDTPTVVLLMREKLNYPINIDENQETVSQITGLLPVNEKQATMNAKKEEAAATISQMQLQNKPDLEKKSWLVSQVSSQALLKGVLINPVINLSKFVKSESYEVFDDLKWYFNFSLSTEKEHS